MKIAVEMLGYVLCIQLSSALFKSEEPPGSERVTVGAAETEVSDNTVTQPFGFSYTRQRRAA